LDSCGGANAVVHISSKELARIWEGTDAMRTNSAESDLAVLREELNTLRAKVAALEKHGRFDSNGLKPVAGPAVTDRRGMMKKMAGLAAGVAAAGLLRPRSSRGKPALDGNFDGDPMIIGGLNAATFNTDLIEGSDSSFRVLSAGLSDAPSIIGRNTNVIVSNPAESVAIFGVTETTGSTTPNANIVGVYGSAISSGTGTHTGVRGTGDDYGVLGSGETGVFGAGNSRGVSGTGTTGVFGSSGVSNGAGVRGEANSGTSAHAVEGISTSGVGGDFQGARAALYLESGAGAVADPNMNPPSSAPSVTFIVDRPTQVFGTGQADQTPTVDSQTRQLPAR
jgi:hypothetical protein